MGGGGGGRGERERTEEGMEFTMQLHGSNSDSFIL